MSAVKNHVTDWDNVQAIDKEAEKTGMLIRESAGATT